MLRRWLPTFALLLVGCTTAPETLVVQLVTDLGPAREFDGITVTVSREDGSTVVEQDLGLSASGYGRPARLLETQASGLVRVDVALSFDGQPVATGHRRTTVSGTSIVTILIERVCSDVVCADDEVCLSAACVDDTCTREHPESCPATACQSDAECGAPSGCVVPRCESGACVALPDDSLCDATFRCDPLGGCVDDVPACTDPEPFGTPELLIELPAAHASAPTVTADELHLFFEGDADVARLGLWETQRRSRSDPFDPPRRILDATESEVFDPLIRFDGLELIFGSYDGADYGCVLHVTRDAIDLPFGPRAPFDDVLCETDPPHEAPSAFFSRDFRTAYALGYTGMPGDRPLEAFHRDTLGSPFDAGRALGVIAGGTPSLTSDGLTVYYEASPGGMGKDTFEVWVAHRSALDAPFEAGSIVEELATPYADGDPEISADGRSIYFFSRRPDASWRRIYVAHRRCAGDP